MTNTVFACLTPREYEVLALLVDGKGTKEIATALVITTTTVKQHVHNILLKCQVKRRYGLLTLWQQVLVKYWQERAQTAEEQIADLIFERDLYKSIVKQQKQAGKEQHGSTP